MKPSLGFSPGLFSSRSPRSRKAFTRLGLGRLAITILHEALHSLGLGEDPPTSTEITRRVESRCGS